MSFFGTFAITGTVDPLTGAFTMTDNMPGPGVFTINCTLPDANGNGGDYTLTTGRNLYRQFRVGRYSLTLTGCVFHTRS